MKFDRTGIILYTIKYRDCVTFYQEKVGLPILFKTDFLTCFEFGKAYLMVEPDEEAIQNKTIDRDRHKICLRMNVENVREFADRLIERGVRVNYQEHDWGTVAKFTDPDGNLCAFKDSPKFEKQVEDFKS